LGLVDSQASCRCSEEPKLVPGQDCVLLGTVGVVKSLHHGEDVPGSLFHACQFLADGVGGDKNMLGLTGLALPSRGDTGHTGPEPAKGIKK
jgi:hypothetical protein